MSTQNNSMNRGAQDRGVEVQSLPTAECSTAFSYTARTQVACSGPAEVSSADSCKAEIAVPAGHWRFRAVGTVFTKDAVVTAKTSGMVDVSC